MYLVLEYMKMGDLINVLKSRGADATTNTVTAGPDGAPVEGTFTPLTDLEVWNIFRQVVSGIRYLHYQNVVHGDIKPQVLHFWRFGATCCISFMCVANFNSSATFHILNMTEPAARRGRSSQDCGFRNLPNALRQRAEARRRRGHACFHVPRAV